MKKGIKDLIIFGTVVTLITTSGIALKKHFNKEEANYEKPKNKQVEQVNNDIRLEYELTLKDGSILYLFASDSTDFTKHNQERFEEYKDEIVKIVKFDAEQNRQEIELPIKENKIEEDNEPKLARVVTNKDGSIDFTIVGSSENLKENDYSIDITEDMQKVQYFDEFDNEVEISIEEQKTKKR